MKRFAATMLALVLGFALVATATAAELVRKQSAFPVAETLDRLAAILAERGVTVGLRIDHAAAAGSIGADLQATQLLLFGNPALGTPLMQEAREIAIDLPMKALAWEDDDGVWLGYIAPADLAARWGIDPEHPAIQKMTAALEATTNLATIPDAVNNPPKGARTVFTGLRYMDLKPGNGGSPADEQRIVRTLTDAWQSDGKQVSNALLDGLDTNQVLELRRPLPILAKALATPPAGGQRRRLIATSLTRQHPRLRPCHHMRAI